MQEGKPLQAANIYNGQLHGPAATDARAGLKTAIDACWQSSDAATVASSFQVLARLPEDVNQPAPLEPDAFKQGLALVDKFRAAGPENALDILNADAELDPTNAALPQLQIGLLKQIVTSHSDNTNRVVELAVAYENNGQLDESCQLLRPYKTKLGATEGARILGQRLLSGQNYQDAYGLLYPYVQARLEKLRNVDVTYSNTCAAISHEAIQDLNNEKAGPDFYNNYKNSTKEQQETLVDDYIQSRMKADPRYQRALTDLKEANRIVPVTLDLGIVQLNRAQELADPDARKSELESAEKTFLAIRGFAGETDEYKLFLGQVYYWLGRSKEGRELFDSLLAKRNRDFPILMAIGKTLRDVGEHNEARKLSEEAYKVAKDNDEKYDAASFRALLSKDEDDQIAWLEKADHGAPWVQVELNEARGKKALQQANKPLAASYLRKAVAGYEKQDKSSAELNNWALACFDLFEATGNAADQEHGMQLFEEAVAMDPGNSILLHNVTYYLISRAARDLNHDAVNFSYVGEQPGLDLLPLFYSNEVERNQVYQQLHDSEAMKRGLGYLDKDLLLAPKELGTYGTALSLHGAFRDLPALQKLQQRFQIAAPDLSEARRTTLEVYSGAKDREHADKLRKHIQSLKDLAAHCDTNSGTLTLTYLNCSLNELQQSLWVYGGEVDAQALLRTMQATHDQHKSAATEGALESAYFFLANQELMQANPDYAALAKKFRHEMAPEFFLAYVLERGGPLAEATRQNANVMKAIAIEKASLANYPSWAGIDEWAMLSKTDPETAAILGKRIKESETIRLMDSLQYQFDPWDAAVVMEQYWTQRLLGDEKKAREIYETAAHDGVPLPPI